jgi:hypothetical protein
MRRALPLGLAMLLSLFGAASAGAATLGFVCLTGNAAADCAIGEAQLSVTVSAGAGAGQVAFFFENTGPAASSLTDVYFDDGTLLGIATISGSAGVSFSQGASPPNLPGADLASPPFQTTAGFSADSDPAVQPNGVNPGESLTITFDLKPGGTLDAVLAELADGRLRIGIRAQGFASGGSESFVNHPLPEPGVLALLGAGAGLAVGRGRGRPPTRVWL